MTTAAMSLFSPAFFSHRTMLSEPMLESPMATLADSSPETMLPLARTRARLFLAPAARSARWSRM